jgi:hypothetical protein
MTLSLQDFRDELRSSCGQDEDDLPNATADRFLNISWWELSDKVDFSEKEAISSFSLASGVRSYPTDSITTDINSIVMVQIRVDDEWVTMKKRDHNELMDGENVSPESYATPERYSKFENSLYFDPTPDKIYPSRISYLRTLDDIAVSGVTIPRVWQEFILLGALARVYRRKGDLQRSAAIRNERNELSLTAQTVKSRETVDLRTVGVQVLRQRYP